MKTLSTEIIMEIDRALRAGEVDTARTKLEQVAGKRVAREHAAKLGSLARRAGFMGLALRLLYPIVRPTSRKAIPASAEESAEYALALATIGATEEAIEIFTELDAERFPQISFFAAMAHLTLWNYEAAVPMLRRYIPSPILDEYRRLVGKLNLASALIALRENEEAERVLIDLDAICSSGGFQLHRGNVLELFAQLSALQRNFSEARRYLDLAAQDAEAFGGRDPLFVKKWRAFLSVMEHGATPENLRLLGAFRDDAAQAEQWESLRQCDRLRAVSTGDRDLLLYLYAGTPSHSFRKQLVADAQLGEIPTHYELVMGKPSPRAKLIETGDSPILAALASDFYRPVREASLFALMHPEECYHPVKSPARVRRAIKALAAKKLPVEIVEKDGAYRLRAKRPCRLRIEIASTFMRDRFAA